MNIYELLGVKNAEELQNFLDGKDNLYLSYPIAKKYNKAVRWIDAPQPDLKALQWTLLNTFLYRFSVHPSCVGFVKGKNVATGAERHLGASQLLNMDLQNFFGSIHQGRVIKLSKFLLTRYKEAFDPKFEVDLKKDPYNLTNLLIFKGHVPQGAPSSPALANLCAYGLDKKLASLAKDNNCIYTRYADDISFSSKTPSDKFNIGTLIPKITKLVGEEQFKVNYKKTRIKRPHNRMTVTGIVVNEKLSTPKWYWRNFRARLHNLNVSQIPVTEEEYQEIRGIAEWIKSLHPERGEKFLNTIGNLNLMF